VFVGQKFLHAYPCKFKSNPDQHSFEILKSQWTERLKYSNKLIFGKEPTGEFAIFIVSSAVL